METYQVVEEMPSPDLKQTNSKEQKLEHIIRTNKMTYNELQKKRFQILCIQTLFNRIKQLFEKTKPLDLNVTREIF